MDKMVHGQLHVKCRFELLKIQKCVIYARYGEHAKAEIAASVREGEAVRRLVDRAKENLEIFVGNAGNKIEELLFAGTVQNIDLIKTASGATIYLCAVSHTWKMNREEHFQGSVDLSRYAHSIAPRYENQMQQNGYQIENLDCLRVGDRLQIQNRTFYVKESCMAYENDILNYSCMAFPDQRFKEEKIREN